MNYPYLIHWRSMNRIHAGKFRHLYKSHIELGKISVQSEYGDGTEFIIEPPKRTVLEVDTIQVEAS